MTLFKKSLLLVAVPLLFEFLFVGTLCAVLIEVDKERAREAHAKEVTNHINVLLKLVLQRGTTSLMGRYLMEKQAWHQELQRITAIMRAENEALSQMVADYPEESAAIQRFTETRDRFERAFLSARGVDTENQFALVKQSIKVQAMMRELFKESEAVVQEETLVQEERRQRLEQYRHLVDAILGLGLGFNVLLAVVLATYFHSGTVKRLNVVIDNTFRLAGGSPLAPELGGFDEISHLDRMFHKLSDDLKDAAERERAVVDNVLDLIFSVDEGARLTSVSQAALKLLEYSPESLIGRRMVDIISKEDLSVWQDSLSLARATGSSRPCEVRMHRRNGGLVDVRISVSYSSKQNTYFCVAHDVTEQREAARLKQEVIAMVSHDLRTPLTAINTALEMIDAGVFGTISLDGKRMIAGVERSSQRMLGLLNDLLALERIKSEMLELDCDTTRLQNVFDQSIQSVFSLADAGHISIVAEPTDLVVWADSDRLVQVVINLVSNAIKFSPAGETISISGTPVDSCIEVAVADRGRGVPPEQREKIFERFQQVQKADAKQLGGSGLGLAICKAIIELHGGSIGIRDNPGGGSIFWFRLDKKIPE